MENTPKNTKLQARIARYGALAAAVSGATSAEAAIVYTDITPDFVGGTGSSYFVDMDNDGTNDFQILQLTSSSSGGVGLLPIATSNEILLASNSYPAAFSSGITIQAAIPGSFSWSSSGGLAYTSSSGPCMGNWCGVTDKYLGVRFLISGNIHYGWIRLDVSGVNGFTVKDYAYEDVAGAPIVTGSTTGGATAADVATNVSGADIANSGNGSDAEIMFTAGANESTIMEYRIMMVKTSLVGSFNLSVAQGVGSANYTAIAPSGSPTYTNILAATATDVDGDAIVDGVPYTAFIMSTQNGGTSTADALSNGSNSFTLSNTVSVKEANQIDGRISHNGQSLQVEVLDVADAGMVTILDLNGKVVRQFSMNRTVEQFDVSELSSAVYVVRLVSKNGQRQVSQKVRFQ